MKLLGLIYLIIGVLTIITNLNLFILKKQKSVNITMIVLILLSVLITFLNVTSLPSNFVSQKIIAYVIGIFAIVGYGLFISKKVPPLIAKGLISASIIGGFLFLIF